jgi:hypothetical protein
VKYHTGRKRRNQLLRYRVLRRVELDITDLPYGCEAAKAAEVAEPTTIAIRLLDTPPTSAMFLIH